MPAPPPDALSALFKHALSGDLHTHTGNITLAMLRAEDVNVAAATIYSSNRPRALEIRRSTSDPLHIHVDNQEIEHWFFGNVFYFDIPQAVQDPGEGDPKMTPLFHKETDSSATVRSSGCE